MEQVQRIEIATEIWQKMNQSALREQLYAAVLEFLKLSKFIGVNCVPYIIKFL
jgi:hypothetical protein